MRSLFVIAVLALLTVEARAALPRVVSTGACADQYVLALAAPEQIAGLSPDARDPALSAAADLARRYPVVATNAETILQVRPDIVVAEGYVAARMAAFLEDHGIRYTLLPSPDSLDAVAQTLKDLGARIGRAEAGQAAARAFDAERARLAASAPAQPLGALYLLPTGTTAGAGTYIDEIMRLGGFANIASDEGVKGWDHVPLETLVQRPPKIVIAGFFDIAPTTVLAGFAQTPLARRTLADARVISVPNALWVCAGPMATDAARYLRARNPAVEGPAP